MGAVTEGLVRRLAAAAQADGGAAREIEGLSVLVEDFEIPFDADGAVVPDGDLRGGHDAFRRDGRGEGGDDSEGSPVDCVPLNLENAVLKARSETGFARLDRSLVRAAGPQRVKFLHGLLSNDIAALGASESRLAALMNVKGQQVAWMRVLALGDALECEMPNAVLDVVLETFLHYKVGAPVRFEKRDTVVFGLCGEGAGAVLREAGLESAPSLVGHFANGALFGAPARVIRADDFPARGFLIHADSAAAAIIEGGLRHRTGEALSVEVLDTLRIEDGLPWHGIDVTAENLLHETGQLSRYHSSAKGCYLGQEVVARLEGRGGHVNKRLMGLRLAARVRAGDPIEFEGERIGAVTSEGASPTLGPVAMGYVHRNQARAEIRVTVAGIEGVTAELPLLA